VLVEASPGLTVIPGATGMEALADLGDREREVLVSSLAPLTAGTDLLLIDTAAGIGRNVVALCAAASEVILVTNPEPTSLTDAYGLVKVLLRRRPEAAIRLLVNSVSGAEEGRSVHRKLDEVVRRFLGTGLDYLGHLPKDDFVGRATLRQMPFVTAYPRCRASVGLAAVADALLGEGRAAAPSAGGRAFWRRLLAVGGGE
jgi:flagellar biosynthesis protein FlhG